MSVRSQLNPIEAGFEMSDWLGFFSSHKRGGFESSGTCLTNTSDEQVWQIRLPSAHVEIQLQEQSDGASWQRRLTLTALEDSLLGDLVLRLVMPAADWKETSNGVFHANKNRYLFALTNTLCLKGRALLESHWETSQAGGFAQQSYWRDEPTDRWVLHHRLITPREKASKLVWRFRYKAVLGPDLGPLTDIAYGFSERVLSRLPGPTPSLQVMGLLPLKQGQKLEIATTVRLTS